MPVLLYVLAVAVFAQGTSEFVLAGLVPGISADLGVPVAQAGWLTAGFAVGMVVGAPLTAALARRLSPRLTLTACLLVFVAAHAVGALTDQLAVLFAGRVVAALANAGFLAVALSTVTRIVPVDRQARALAAVLAGTTLALVAGVPAGALLGALWGWRSALWAIAGLATVALVAVAALTPRRPGPDGPRGDLRVELGTLRSPVLRHSLALGVLVNGATFCAFTYVAPVVTDAAGLAPVVVPAVLVLFGLGAFAGVTAAGRLAGTHGRLVLWVGTPALVAGWTLWATLAASPTAVWVLAPVQGALSFGVGGTLIARTMAAAHGAPTLGGSFPTVALNLGALLGPVLGGWALGPLGTTGPMVAGAALAAGGALLWAAPVLARRSVR